jgi:phosphatidylglycerol---prolipoprotein diacylglyceryl transferase
MNPGIEIGPLTIRYYGIILMFGALMAAFMTSWLAKRRSINTEIVWDALLWVLIGGIIGARLWHVILPSTADLVLDVQTGQLANPYFVGGKVHLLDILTVWKGGLGIPGALLGGMLALAIYCRGHKLSTLLWYDLAMPGVALAQAIGRWGNYVNGELCGSPTQLPWGITRCFGTGYPEGTTFHPIFLYESIWSLLNMAILLVVGEKAKKWLYEGDIFLLYLIIYPLGRFLLEFIRMDVALIHGLNANQSVMAVVALGALAVLIGRHLIRRKTA